MMEEENTFL